MRWRPPFEVVAVLVCAALGYGGLGPAGAVGGAVAGYVVGLFMLRLDLAPAIAAARRRRRPAAMEDAQFGRYRSIVSAVVWAGHSPRHRDRMLRPVLQQIAAARLSDRHAVDPVTAPERARALLGLPAWHLVDPHRPPSEDSAGPGIALPELALVVQRLEEL